MRSSTKARRYAPPRRLRGILLGGVLLAVALPSERAEAQHPGFGTPDPRPLHERIRDADAIAIATVQGSSPDRVAVADAVAVRGLVAETFELKRAPSRPVPLAPGDRALLLLRGARSPYLLVDAPHELIRLGEDDDPAAWSAALQALEQAPDPVRVYLRWLDATSAGLQREAAIALADVALQPADLAPAALRLADLALHGQTATARRFAARSAVRTEAGRERLLERVPAGEAPDTEVLATALRAAPGAAPAAGRDALLRALDHDGPEVRATAVRASVPFARDREVRAALVRIASEDPDASLRALARQIMKGPQRPTPDRPDASDGVRGPLRR